jgi:hypothetical protein
MLVYGLKVCLKSHTGLRMIKKLTLVLLLVTFGLSGCVATTPLVEPPWVKNIRYNGDDLEVIDMQSWNIENQGIKVLLSLQVKNFLPVQNRPFRHRILWYKSSGEPIKTTLSYWQRVSGKSDSRHELSYMSPSFTVEIEDL